MVPTHLIIEMKILVTVGTTQFQELIQFTDSKAFVSLVESYGIPYENILYQIGQNGKYTPKNSFRMSKQIMKIYNEHDIIITHGGAGTLLACLKMGKRIIAVSNNSLAGNHQTQIINQLKQASYLLGFECIEDIKNNFILLQKFFNKEILFTPYVPAKMCLLNNLIFKE